MDQVHGVLGRHRADDERSGWISGLPEAEGAERPTAGGLRIGKPRNERGPSDAYDAGAEWDRDGQYYHYLTKWMFAVDRTWRVTGNAAYHRQAVDLARTAHAGFMIRSRAGRRLAWKMSIDLSRPLVPSSGLHDLLDGLITTSALVATRPEGVPGTILDAEIGELDALCQDASWATDDPLGVGGLLVDLLRCIQLTELDHPTGLALMPSVAADARASLDALSDFTFLDDPPGRRLAFRELGLAIGLRGVARLHTHAVGADAAVPRTVLAALHEHEPVGDRILDVWSGTENRRARAWIEHQDISEVMWATCLAPEGFLTL